MPFLILRHRIFTAHEMHLLIARVSSGQVVERLIRWQSRLGKELHLEQIKKMVRRHQTRLDSLLGFVCGVVRLVILLFAIPEVIFVVFVGQDRRALVVDARLEPGHETNALM